MSNLLKPKLPSESFIIHWYPSIIKTSIRISMDNLTCTVRTATYTSLYCTIIPTTYSFGIPQFLHSNKGKFLIGQGMFHFPWIIIGTFTSVSPLDFAFHFAIQRSNTIYRNLRLFKNFRLFLLLIQRRTCGNVQPIQKWSFLVQVPQYPPKTLGGVS
jgi:hypothetical protein